MALLGILAFLKIVKCNIKIYEANYCSLTVEGCSGLFVTQFPQTVPFYTSFYGQCDASLEKEY